MALDRCEQDGDACIITASQVSSGHDQYGTWASMAAAAALGDVVGDPSYHYTTSVTIDADFDLTDQTHHNDWEGRNGASWLAQQSALSACKSAGNSYCLGTFGRQPYPITIGPCQTNGARWRCQASATVVGWTNQKHETFTGSYSAQAKSDLESKGIQREAEWKASEDCLSKSSSFLVCEIIESHVQCGQGTCAGTATAVPWRGWREHNPLYAAQVEVTSTTNLYSNQDSLEFEGAEWTANQRSIELCKQSDNHCVAYVNPRNPVLNCHVTNVGFDCEVQGYVFGATYP